MMRLPGIMLVFFLLSCASDSPQDLRYNRFIESLEPASEIGNFSRLTEDGRNLYPAFDPGDSIIYFRRLLVTEASDTTGRKPDELIKPYGIGIADGKLYTLSDNYVYPEGRSAESPSLNNRAGETVTRALSSPDGNTIAYETVVGTSLESHTVYLLRGDSTTQLTYGGMPCFVDRFSNTGRYLTVICGLENPRIIIFDLTENVGYRIETEGDHMDYMTSFSSDDHMMVFIRSEKKYSLEYDFLGDIWLMRFSR
jgi:hypothetical protein